MATVAEVRQAIATANTLIAEAQAAVNTIVAAKIGEAQTQVAWVQQTSVDPLGLPPLNAALELTEQIAALCHAAIEANETYARGM